MSRGILHSAVSNPALRLELEYQTSATRELRPHIEEIVMDNEFVDSNLSRSREFACLIKALRGSDGEAS